MVSFMEPMVPVSPAAPSMNFTTQVPSADSPRWREEPKVKVEEPVILEIRVPNVGHVVGVDKLVKQVCFSANILFVLPEPAGDVSSIVRSGK